MARLAIIAACAATPVADALATGGSVPQICVSRIYDFLNGAPVTHFAIDFRYFDIIDEDVYAQYRMDMVAAATPLGYDPVSVAYTLHETLSEFPFENYGRIRSLVLVLCATGREAENDCRRAEYYITDRTVNPERLALMLQDVLTEPTPAPVAGCDFSLGDWAAVNAP